MHTCCAPCSVFCIDTLRKEGIEPTLYWYNPNIHPYKEYEARRDCLKSYVEKIKVKAVFNDEYGLDEFCKSVANNLNSRCVDYCYPVRLRKTFEYAKENGYDAVTTTLLYSIYQKHNYIKKLCEEYSKEYGIDFLYRDFRYGFWEGHDKAIEEGLYMQKYCGCVFSEEERYIGNNTEKPQLPEGMELKKRKSIQVKKIENKEDYLDVLQQNNDYANLDLSDAIIYGLKVEENIVSLAVISIISSNTVALKYLYTRSEFRNKGYANKLLKSLCGNYKQNYCKMIVGTTEAYIPFFVKQGFDTYEEKSKLIYYSKKL